MSTFMDTLDLLVELPRWLWRQAFARVDNMDADSEGTLRYVNKEVEPGDANLITSRLSGQPDAPWDLQLHRPVLDLDFEAHLRPSSTPGHYHLFLDKPMSRAHYKKLLGVLEEVGVLQKGFADSGLGSNLGTAVRVPWVKKDAGTGVPAGRNPF